MAPVPQPRFADDLNVGDATSVGDGLRTHTTSTYQLPIRATKRSDWSRLRTSVQGNTWLRDRADMSKSLITILAPQDTHDLDIVTVDAIVD